MTVDMLAATFFWPEGTLLGAHGLPPDDAAPLRAPDDGSDADAAATADGFWATVARHLWRPASLPSTEAVG